LTFLDHLDDDEKQTYRQKKENVVKSFVLQRAIFCSLLVLCTASSLASESAGEDAKRNCGSVVFCNQGDQAMLADITASLGSIRTTLSSCDQRDSKVDIIISQIDQLTENLSVVDTSLCSKLEDIISQFDTFNRDRLDLDEELGRRSAGVVFCNQGERAQIDQVSSCCAAIKASLGSPGSGEPNLHSKANIIESLIEEIAEVTINASGCDGAVIESKLDIITEEVSISDATLCTKLITIQSQVDINGSVVEDIDSKVDILCSKILVVDSQTDSVESLLDVIESKIDVNTSITDLVQSEVEIIDSNLDIVCSKLEGIDSKVDVIDIDLSLTDESLCSKLMVIDSKVDVIDSITDDLHDTACIGIRIIRNADLPFTIVSPGLYSIGEDLTWAANGAAISITAGIDGVDIDFHCNALVVINSAATLPQFGIYIVGGSGQVGIRNGRMQSITGNTTPATTLISKLGDGTESLLTIENMTFISDAQTNTPLHRHIVASATNDIHVFDCTFFQGTRAIETSACNRLDIFNCQFNRIFDQAIFNLVDFNVAISNCDFQLCGEDINSISSQHIAIENCTHLQSGRIDTYNSVSFNTCNDVVVKNCTNQGAGTGTGATAVDAYATIASQCVMYLNNSINGGVRNGIALDAACVNCKVIDNAIDCMASIGINNDIAAVSTLVLGNCVAHCGANYSAGVAASVIATGLVPGPGSIPDANNRWINASF
jgi:hypothetical protein